MSFLRRLRSGNADVKTFRDGPYMYFVGPGGLQAVKSGSGPLYDRFMGIGDGADGKFTQSDQGYVRAYKASAWAFRCVKIRAQVLAGIPLTVRRADEEIDHPLSKALSRGRLIDWTERDFCIFGRAFWSWGFYPNGNAWLRRLNPTTIQVDADVRGLKGFKQEIEGRTVREFAPAELVYFNDYDPDDDFGSVSPVSLALTGVGVTENISIFAEYYFANGAMPQGILVSETKIASESDRKRILEEWEKRFQGPKNAHKTALLDGGKISYVPVTPSLVDLAMTELREEERREIAAALFVPPVMAGITDAANYATAQEQRKSLYTEALIPEAGLFCDVINTQLVPHFNIPDIEVQPDLNDVQVIQEDRTEITQRNQVAVTAGYMSLNEARKREDLDPLPVDYFQAAGKLIPRTALEAGDLSSLEPPPAAPSFPFGQSVQALPEPVEQRALPPLVIDNPPQKSTVDIVIHAPDPESAAERKQTVIRDTALEDLRRWEKKIAKKGVFTPFDPDYLPPALTAFLRADLQSWDGEADRDAWIKRAFEGAEVWFKADGEDFPTLEEFERFWAGYDDLFNAIAGAFETSWEGLPARLAVTLREQGTAGAEVDLSSFAQATEQDMIAKLLGTPEEPGPLVAVVLAGAARGDELLHDMKSLKATELSISWDAINTLARQWAETYCASLVRGINDTTLNIFRAKIAEWVDDGGSLEDLAKYIEGDLQGLDIPPNWSPGKVQWATSRERARLIAQSETTGAFFEGNVSRWEQAGVTEGKWRTQRDTHVDDKICRPLNNMVGNLRTGWIHPKTGKVYKPPAHPGCRCFAQPLPGATQI